MQVAAEKQRPSDQSIIGAANSDVNGNNKRRAVGVLSERALASGPPARRVLGCSYQADALLLELPAKTVLPPRTGPVGSRDGRANNSARAHH